MSRLLLYVDGSVHPNPGGLGGWAWVMVFESGEPGRGEREVVGQGHGPVLEPVGTTNNRAEVFAAVKAIEAARGFGPVTVVSDSQYVAHGAADGSGFIRRLNSDAWDVLKRTVMNHEGTPGEEGGGVVSWEWTPGHAKTPENELADALATAGRLLGSLCGVGEKDACEWWRGGDLGAALRLVSLLYSKGVSDGTE